uniref:Ribosome production factor 2 homolog n=1 Tax=Bursaphelenchus xylophilus TaxID=6326 RepID=A0A1I7S740_BURXY
MAPIFNKAKTRRGKKFLEDRAPKITENDKNTLLLKGGKTNETLQSFLTDIHALKKPLVEKLKYRNPIHLFDEESFICKMSHKYDSSIFCMIANSKKHPNMVCIGRMFDYELLDLVELRLSNYVPQSSFKNGSVGAETKPCIVLNGSLFEVDDSFKRVGNMLVDFFRGAVVDSIRLQGLELVISLTATADGKVLMRTYRSILKKSSGSSPRVELVDLGPHADFEIVRSKFASDSLMKKATKKPKVVNKMRKNTSLDPFETKLARIHVGKQDLNSIQTRKVKALKRKKE